MMSVQDYSRIERAILFISEHAADQPDLKRVAAEVGLSEFHFQRLFRRWAGVSPKKFLQFVTAAEAGGLLRERTVLDVSYDVGLSGPGRLHDLMISVNAVTPGEIRRGGGGLEIRWGLHPSPFGECFLAVTDRGVCDMSFPGEAVEHVVADVQRLWPAATLIRDQAQTRSVATRIFSRNVGPGGVSLLLKGTNFQLQVWQALLAIPPGAVTTYGAIANSIGAPTAARAVGAAIGANRIAFLIPCHRVIRGTYAFGNYRWGPVRKKAILAWESLGTHPEDPHRDSDQPPAGAIRST